MKQQQTLNVYYIQNVSQVQNDGSLYSDPALIPEKDVLLLVDSVKNEVHTYNMTSHEKIVRIRGVGGPSSVTYSFYNNTIFYIVCVHGENYINLYDSQWYLVRRINTMYPRSAIISPEQTIFVLYSKRVSQFLGILLSLSYDIHLVSFSYPHLWLLKTLWGEPVRYKLYDDRNIDGL